MKAITNEEIREKLPRQAKNTKSIVEIGDDDDSIENIDTVQKLKGVRVTKTGKSLDQDKMLRRKVDNCNKSGWITINHSAGQYPMQVHLTLKTGMFELLQNNFLAYMKSFNIFPQNKQNPETCVKITQNDNGIERYEYDLIMEIDGTSAGLKVKLYSTKSSLDVQGLKSYFSKEMEALGNRTIAVYFAEVVIEAIFQCMMNNYNLEQFNEYCKEQLNIGLASHSNQQINKNSEAKSKKSKNKLLSDLKCNICDSNTKELNSFKCHECAHMFHKLCVNKRTSSAEFALIKSGDVAYSCDECIGKRRGFDTTNKNSFNIVEAIKEIVNECVEIEDDEDNETIPKAIEYQPEKSNVNDVTNIAVNTLNQENTVVNTSGNKCTSKSGCENCENLGKELTLLNDQKENLRKEHEAFKLEMETWKEEVQKKENENAEILDKLKCVIKEKDELVKELEKRNEDEKLEEERWQRANLDFDRLKGLHEKVTKENVKITENFKKEIKEILKQKLEADNRYHDLVNEREKFREKERILLNTFDLWKSKFEQSRDKDEESTNSTGSSYECEKCVYEATTIADLRKHDLDIHTPEIKCEHCGHIVLSESDLRGHIEAYHTVNEEESDTVYLCTLCDDEYKSKIELEVHTRSNHSQDVDLKCDKCEYEGETIADLKIHRQSAHYHFKYFCCACDYETLNKDVLKKHKIEKHRNPLLETRKEKQFPPPKCDLTDPSHNTECCDRTQGAKKHKIFSRKERETNGICLNWNKGYCEFSELCKFAHIEIEECRFAYSCSRKNCRYWHDIPGKFPFLAMENPSKIRKW